MFLELDLLSLVKDIHTLSAILDYQDDSVPIHTILFVVLVNKNSEGEQTQQLSQLQLPSDS